MTRPEVSLVIVAFHRAEQLASLLSSVAAPEIEIVVVNIEADPDVARVAAARDVRVCDVVRNVGFAAGVNVGVAAAVADIVVFSNDDIVANASDVRALAAIVRGGDATVAVPKLVDRFGRHERSIAALPTIDALVRELLLLPDAPVPRLATHVAVQKWRAPDQPERIDAARAAFVAAPRALLTAEPLPEAYFLYWEEMEWFWRLRARGEVVEYRPDVVACHAGGRTDVRADKARLVARNAVRCVRRTQGRGRAAIALPVVWLWQLRLLVLALVRRRDVSARVAGLGASFAAVREVLR